jgi:glucosamine--fructose-6-phosphate aminotransferase (isomerizing)
MSILEKEIWEQPAVVGRILELEAPRVASLTSHLQGRFDHLFIAARGTSDNAARYANYLFGAHNRLQVALATPSLFTLYRKPPRLDGALVIGISQSGQSPDIVTVVQEGRHQGHPTIAITNELKSPLAEAAEFVIPMQAGTEHAIPATKTYTASLAVLALLSALLANDPVRLDQLGLMPEHMSRTLANTLGVIEQVQNYREMSLCTVVGRGFNYGTAFEIALKIREMDRVIAEPYSSADFQHGPIAMIDAGYPVIVVAPDGAVVDDMLALVQRLRGLRAELLMISDRPDLLQDAQLGFPLPSGVPEWLTPLITVLPAQVFGLYLARLKGLNPDVPDGINKVTRTF